MADDKQASEQQPVELQDSDIEQVAGGKAILSNKGKFGKPLGADPEEGGE